MFLESASTYIGVVIRLLVIRNHQFRSKCWINFIALNFHDFYHIPLLSIYHYTMMGSLIFYISNRFIDQMTYELYTFAKQ